MITRKEYLKMESSMASHRAFWSQFVTPYVKVLALDFGLERLREALENGAHLNSIPLREWDRIRLPPCSVKLLKEAGEHYTLCGQVCVLKEAARQIVEDMS